MTWVSLIGSHQGRFTMDIITNEHRLWRLIVLFTTTMICSVAQGYYGQDYDQLPIESITYNIHLNQIEIQTDLLIESGTLLDAQLHWGNYTNNPIEKNHDDKIIIPYQDFNLLENEQNAYIEVEYSAFDPFSFLTGILIHPIFSAPIAPIEKHKTFKINKAVKTLKDNMLEELGLALKDYAAEIENRDDYTKLQPHRQLNPLFLFAAGESIVLSNIIASESIANHVLNTIAMKAATTGKIETTLSEAFALLKITASPFLPASKISDMMINSCTESKVTTLTSCDQLDGFLAVDITKKLESFFKKAADVLHKNVILESNTKDPNHPSYDLAEEATVSIEETPAMRVIHFFDGKYNGTSITLPKGLVSYSTEYEYKYYEAKYFTKTKPACGAWCIYTKKDGNQIEDAAIYDAFYRLKDPYIVINRHVTCTERRRLMQRSEEYEDLVEYAKDHCAEDVEEALSDRAHKVRVREESPQTKVAINTKNEPLNKIPDESGVLEVTDDSILDLSVIIMDSKQENGNEAGDDAQFINAEVIITENAIGAEHLIGLHESNAVNSCDDKSKIIDTCLNNLEDENGNDKERSNGLDTVEANNENPYQSSVIIGIPKTNDENGNDKERSNGLDTVEANNENPYQSSVIIGIPKTNDENGNDKERSNGLDTVEPNNENPYQSSVIIGIPKTNNDKPETTSMSKCCEFLSRCCGCFTKKAKNPDKEPQNSELSKIYNPNHNKDFCNCDICKTYRNSEQAKNNNAESFQNIEGETNTSYFTDTMNHRTRNYSRRGAISGRCSNQTIGYRGHIVGQNSVSYVLDKSEECLIRPRNTITIQDPMDVIEEEASALESEDLGREIQLSSGLGLENESKKRFSTIKVNDNAQIKNTIVASESDDNPRSYPIISQLEEAPDIDKSNEKIRVSRDDLLIAESEDLITLIKIDDGPVTKFQSRRSEEFGSEHYIELALPLVMG